MKAAVQPGGNSNNEQNICVYLRFPNPIEPSARGIENVNPPSLNSPPGRQSNAA